jgi:hypothetical protein
MLWLTLIKKQLKMGILTQATHMISDNQLLSPVIQLKNANISFTTDKKQILVFISAM